MKKVVVTILIAVLCVSMIACTAAPQESAVASEAPNASASTEQPAETKATAEESAQARAAAQESAQVSEVAPTEDGKTVKVAFSIPEMFSTFWEACWTGFEQQAKDYGWEATLLDPQGDLELQISQLQNQVTQGVDAIGVAPIENEAIGPALTTINEAGVPVFCVDRRGKGDVVSTLETDNVKAGEAMAEQIINDYGETIKVLIIQGVLSDTPTLDRTQGVKNVLAKYDTVEIVGEPSAGEYSNEAAMATAKNFLESNPDIDVIFTCTDALVPGIVAALKEAGKNGVVGDENHVGLYSVDGAGEVLKMIESGVVDGTFSQYPIQFGIDTVKAMKAYMDGEQLEEKVYYDGDVVTKANIAELHDTLWGYIVG